MAIVAMLGGLALVLNMDNYRSYIFSGERNTIINVLQKARSQAINNICLGSGCTNGRSHGVYIQDDKYTIFQGTYQGMDWDHRDASVDEEIEANGNMTISGSVSSIVFEQLSGNATTVPLSIPEPWTIIISDSAGHNNTVSVNSEGRISW